MDPTMINQFHLKIARAMSSSPLINLVASNGDINVVKDLLKSGVDIDAKYKYDKTLLHQAAKKNWLDIVKYLVENGANIEAIDKSDGNTPLHEAVVKNNICVVKYLVESGANLNAMSIMHNTPLHRAAYWNHMEIAKYLLECGADNKIKNKDFNRETACEVAYRRARDVAYPGDACEIARYIESFEFEMTKGVHCDD